MYGYRKIQDDLRELGEECGRNRVERSMQAEGLRSQTGYKRRPGLCGAKPTVASPNHLARQFKVSEPNKFWVTDITYTHTYEGWLYLAVVLDLMTATLRLKLTFSKSSHCAVASSINITYGN